MSDHMYEKVRPALKTLIPDDDAYKALFSEFEFILAACFADTEYGRKSNVTWTGTFSWRYRHDLDRLIALVDERSDGLIRAGLFPGSNEFATARDTTVASARNVPWF
jgi:hypothetical protein